MTKKINIGILGYGNLGKGVELAISKNEDMNLVGIFSRRNPKSIQAIFNKTKTFSLKSLEEFKEKIDVLILCGGSRNDLPLQGPKYAKEFNTVDSFDTHAKIPEYFKSIDSVAKSNKKVALISAGWDPGMFSINRVFFEALVPDGASYTFWGKGLSQGHSDAIRKVEGVKLGVQYTIPSNEVINEVRSGKRPDLPPYKRHKRECYVVLKEGANSKEVEKKIVTMPDYFAEYETKVHFINEEEFTKNHNKMPHGGFVIRSANSSQEHNQVMEFSLKLDSNPEFTASVLVAYARACYRLSKSGNFGAKTVFDVAPSLVSIKTDEELRAQML
jgi:diaminopimelate dehydrogenase